MAIMNRLVRAAATAALFLSTAGMAMAETMINAEVVNQSEQVRWVRITDMNCGTVLHEDRMDANGVMPVSICADESGHGKLQFYIRIGCTKNQTVIRKDIEEGTLVGF
jgi:hypothetical protein